MYLHNWGSNSNTGNKCVVGALILSGKVRDISRGATHVKGYDFVEIGDPARFHRADNTPGLGYYGKMGIKEVDRLIAVPLSDGTPVDRVIRRFEF